MFSSHLITNGRRSVLLARLIGIFNYEDRRSSSKQAPTHFICKFYHTHVVEKKKTSRIIVARDTVQSYFFSTIVCFHFHGIFAPLSFTMSDSCHYSGCGGSLFFHPGTFCLRDLTFDNLTTNYLLVGIDL